MSRLFGPVRQIAFIVRDLDRTLKYWTETLGVGPFFVAPRLVPEDFRYRGEPSVPPCITIALAYSGDLQVEIIKQHDTSPSGYLDFLESGREGFQHVSSWYKRDGYDRARERLMSSGINVLHEGRIAGANVRFAYFATDIMSGGLVYEMSDMLDEPIASRMRQLLAAAEGWDGANPVRDMAGKPYVAQ